MTDHFVIRKAQESDASIVVDLWQETAAWLHDRGSDQWQYPVKLHNVHKAIDNATCWIVEAANGDAVATVTLDENADPDLWQPQDDPPSALYVHRLVVSLHWRKMELGSAILDWASEKAMKADRD